jgi:hypothetical protein
MNIENKANKAALLILLEESDRRLDALEQTFPQLTTIVQELRDDHDLEITKEEGYLRLKTGIVLDLFQDVPHRVERGRGKR